MPNSEFPGRDGIPSRELGILTRPVPEIRHAPSTSSVYLTKSRYRSRMFQHRVLSAEESVMQAIHSKDLESLELTLQQYKRVNIDFLSSEGITPLMHAIILYAGTGGKGAVEVKLLQTFLGLQPNLSAQDSSEGRTALHWAVLFDLRELVLRLIEMGADHTLKDLAGMDPIHFAVEVNAETCLQV